MINKKCLLVQLVLLLVASSLACADPAITVRKEIVRITPENQSEEVVTLAAGQKVELQERQGGWYRVELEDGKSGWLPLLSIRKEGSETVKHQKSKGLRNLLSSFRTGSSGVTVATGVRGLDAVDLKNSKPNMEELARIYQFTCDADDARSYAARAGLVSRDVAWIPADKKGR